MSDFISDVIADVMSWVRSFPWEHLRHRQICNILKKLKFLTLFRFCSKIISIKTLVKKPLLRLLLYYYLLIGIVAQSFVLSLVDGKR